MTRRHRIDPPRAGNTFRVAAANRQISLVLPDLIYQAPVAVNPRLSADPVSNIRDTSPAGSARRSSVPPSLGLVPAARARPEPAPAALSKAVTPDPPRDQPPTCKARPADSRRGGGGGSRDFIPWCSRGSK